MIPPTSIDGTDITGASIDGTDVQEITVDGDVVFNAGPAIIDDFESGNINNYSGDTGSFNVTSTNPIQGSNTLEGFLTTQYIFSQSGLANYPQAGDSFSFKMRVEGNVNVASGMVFGIQSNTSQNYCVRFVSTAGLDEITFLKNVSSGNFGQTLTTFAVSPDYNNDDFRFEIDWGTNGVFNIRAFNENTNQQVASGTFTDTDYTSGGIGWFVSNATSSESYPDRILFDQALIL